MAQHSRTGQRGLYQVLYISTGSFQVVRQLQGGEDITMKDGSERIRLLYSLGGWQWNLSHSRLTFDAAVFWIWKRHTSCCNFDHRIHMRVYADGLNRAVRTRLPPIKYLLKSFWHLLIWMKRVTARWTLSHDFRCDGGEDTHGLRTVVWEQTWTKTVIILRYIISARYV